MAAVPLKQRAVWATSRTWGSERDNNRVKAILMSQTMPLTESRSGFLKPAARLSGPDSPS